MYILLLYDIVCDSGCFFFFKQKTAYEMRISDWSSDVCSSDLYIRPRESNEKPSISTGAIPAMPFAPPVRLEKSNKTRRTNSPNAKEIGRASRRERVCQYV